MKEYLLLFWNQAGDGRYQIDADKMKDDMAAWQSWIGKIAMKGRLISTKPVQFDGLMVGNDGITDQPAILEKLMVTGYLLCKADSIHEVKEWAKSCPILKSASGFTEVREILPFEV